MGCCTLRPHRPVGEGVNNDRLLKRHSSQFHNDVYKDPLFYLDEAESNTNEKNYEKNIESLSPLKPNLETYNSLESRGRMSNKDILKKKNSEGKSCSYTPNRSSTFRDSQNQRNSRSISQFDNFDNKNELEEINRKISLQINFSNLKILNEQIFYSVNLDLLNEIFFNNNYKFSIVLNFNNNIFYSDLIPFKNPSNSQKSDNENLNLKNRKSFNFLPNKTEEILNSDTNNENIFFEEKKNKANNNILTKENIEQRQKNFSGKKRDNSEIRKSISILKTENLNLNESSNDLNLSSSFTLPSKSQKNLIENPSKQSNSAQKYSYFTLENNFPIFFNVDEREIKNHFFSINIFLSNKLIPSYRTLIAESYIPLTFFNLPIDENSNKFEIPLIHKLDNVAIAYINFSLEKNDKEKEGKFLNNLNSNKKNLLNPINHLKSSLENYAKYQILKLNQYNPAILKKLGFLNQINSLEFANIKIKLLDMIKKYAIDNAKNEALLELSELLKENNLNHSIDNVNLSSDNTNANNKSNTDIKKQEEDKRIKRIVLKLDFSNISFVKYFNFLSIITESLIDQGERANLIVNSNFIYERIIFNPFTRSDEKLLKEKKFENMVIADLFFSLILSIKKLHGNPLINPIRLDCFYNDCVFIFRDLGSFFLSAKTNILYLVNEIKRTEKIKKNFINNNMNNKSSSNKILDEKKFEDLNIYNQERKEECFFNLLYNVIMKYISIVNNMIESYIKALKDYPDNQSIQAKAESVLVDLKNNIENFVIKKLDEISLSDLNMGTAILNLIFSIAKFGQIFSNTRKISRIDCYISYITNDSGHILEWLSKAFEKFYFSNKFFKIFVELTELISSNSILLYNTNLIQAINLKKIYSKFIIDAKNLDSKKFTFWFVYLKFLNNVIQNNKTDTFLMTDFYYINIEDFVKHINDLFFFIFNYPYFKIISYSYLTYGKEKNTIFTIDKLVKNQDELGFSLSNTLENHKSNKSFYKKFLSTYQSVLILSKVIDIMFEIFSRKSFFNKMKELSRNIYEKCLDYLYFLTFYEYDVNHSKEKANEIKEIFANIHVKIIKILYSLSENLKIDILVTMKRSLKKILKISSTNKNSPMTNTELDQMTKIILIEKLNEKMNLYRNFKNEKSFNYLEKMLIKLRK